MKQTRPCQKEDGYADILLTATCTVLEVAWYRSAALGPLLLFHTLTLQEWSEGRLVGSSNAVDMSQVASLSVLKWEANGMEKNTCEWKDLQTVCLCSLLFFKVMLALEKCSFACWSYAPSNFPFASAVHDWFTPPLHKNLRFHVLPSLAQWLCRIRGSGAFVKCMFLCSL